MRALAGWLLLVGMAWTISEDRRRIPWRVVWGGLALQVLLGGLLVDVPAARGAILLLDGAVAALQDATDSASAFLFGYLAAPPLPFVERAPGLSVILAFKVLPLVLVISALSSLLFHWGVLQRLADVLAALLRRSLGVDGPLALAAALHVFVGNIEAPLLIRPYLAGMQRGELFAVMSCGMAGIAGTVMVIYATILGPVIPGALATIVSASVVSTPAAIALSALMVPFVLPGRAEPPGATSLDAKQPSRLLDGHGQAITPVPPQNVLEQDDRPARLSRQRASGSLDALARGTADGMAPLVGIASTLIVALSLVGLLNAALSRLPGSPTLQDLFALPFRPVLWLIGIPWAQCGTASLLMGTKTVLNEFVAYIRLAALPPTALDARSRVIMVYALCGFANFGSLGIVIGGMGAMVPQRRAEIASLGLRCVLAGTSATCMSGALAGLLS